VHDQTTRAAILRLREAGRGTRAIARALGISRAAVREVIKRGTDEVPPLRRDEKAAPHHDLIAEQYAACRGNLVRVHEELAAAGVTISYPALTAYCRRTGLVRGPVVPAGRYHFEPGSEMQHDTSPHDVALGDRVRRVQTASLVFCYSRLLFFQHYPRFDRFTCKVFLTDALRYAGGAASQCMIDNTHVVVLHGTGVEMVPVPEMEAFAERFGFRFVAHEKGDADRSGRVERPFHFIENNFLAGRTFADWDDLNRRAAEWCDKVNATPKRHLHARPRDLFAVERPRLHPLPGWVPDVYALHQRITDVEGYVTVHTNRYSLPSCFIGRRVEVRETKDAILVFEGPRQIAAHKKVVDHDDAWVTAPEHRHRRGEGPRRRDSDTEEKALIAQAPELAEYIEGIKRRRRLVLGSALRRLRAMVRDYPRPALVAAVQSAHHYGLYDLDRLERLVLRHIARDFFNLPIEPRTRGGRDGEDDDDR
jgi:transposase